MQRPGIEPGPPAWQARILPLNQRCLMSTVDEWYLNITLSQHEYLTWYIFVYSPWSWGNVGSVVEFSPATREARVRFPDVAIFWLHVLAQTLVDSLFSLQFSNFNIQVYTRLSSPDISCVQTTYVETQLIVVVYRVCSKSVKTCFYRHLAAHLAAWPLFQSSCSLNHYILISSFYMNRCNMVWKIL